MIGPTNPDPDTLSPRRYAAVIALKPDQIERYKQLHAEVWPEVLAQIERSDIRNYSIHLTHLHGHDYLFSYFEYHGSDFEASMALMAQDEATQRWWTLTAACQQPVYGDSWHFMETVFAI
ncbi:MAG: L-rhamnose mutarotase [Gammaproteobacteria bacterium]|nr:L-rhamnose mutarotase [Gammaproteobacteria bacterium]